MTYLHMMDGNKAVLANYARDLQFICNPLLKTDVKNQSIKESDLYMTI